MPRSTTEVIYDHLAKRYAGDTDADIEHNFAEDIVLLSSFGEFHGKDGVRRSAEKLFEELGPSEFIYDHTMVNGEFGFLEWSAHSDSRIICDGADSFVVRDGLIIMQTVHYSLQDRPA